MMKQRVLRIRHVFLLGFLLLFTSASVFAASVDTISIHSDAMRKDAKCVVILPDSYKNSTKRYPVVYLLHGYSGNYSDWIKKVPNLEKNADKYQFIIVCPDGNYNSWYIDSPIDSTIKYETYISTEVPNFIDKDYRTLAERKFRAITGLSMGGQGSLSIAWKHADFFGACGSMSGVQDLVPWKDKYELSNILGNTNDNANFEKYSVLRIVKNVPHQIPAIIIDCGVDDPFIETNRKLHFELLELKIPHDYTERNGTHNWDYWGNAVRYQFEFFSCFFRNL
jgi:S-formylglutathione hydrolase FrmB